MKYSTILSQRAIFLSLPIWKPKNSSGEVISLIPFKTSGPVTAAWTIPRTGRATSPRANVRQQAARITRSLLISESRLAGYAYLEWRRVARVC